MDTDDETDQDDETHKTKRARLDNEVTENDTEVDIMDFMHLPEDKMWEAINQHPQFRPAPRKRNKRRIQTMTTPLNHIELRDNNPHHLRIAVHNPNSIANDANQRRLIDIHDQIKPDIMGLSSTNLPYSKVHNLEQKLKKDSTRENSAKIVATNYRTGSESNGTLNIACGTLSNRAYKHVIHKYTTNNEPSGRASCSVFRARDAGLMVITVYAHDSSKTAHKYKDEKSDLQKWIQDQIKMGHNHNWQIIVMGDFNAALS